MIIWILFIIGLVVSTIIVNGFQRLLMKWLNLSAMFISIKTKIIAIVVLALVLTACTMYIFEIQIPH
ncbi:MAG: hypothetical protein ACYDG2_10430 [Ruminiclostridium sp.]